MEFQRKPSGKCVYTKYKQLDCRITSSRDIICDLVSCLFPRWCIDVASSRRHRSCCRLDFNGLGRFRCQNMRVSAWQTFNELVFGHRLMPRPCAAIRGVVRDEFAWAFLHKSCDSLAAAAAARPFVERDVMGRRQKAWDWRDHSLWSSSSFLPLSPTFSLSPCRSGISDVRRLFAP